MNFAVRIALTSSPGQPGRVAESTEVLESRLRDLAGGRDTWSTVRAVPRHDPPPAMGPVQDLIVGFVLEPLAGQAVQMAALMLVRAVMGHFRSQSEDEQSVEITQTDDDGQELRIRLYQGMPQAELEQAEADLRSWIERHGGA